jgi:pyruvate dehydrogenase E1 component beta subunit
VREITYLEAIREALREEMQRDNKVFLLGEDIGKHGGAFGVTKGLWDEFGPDRVRETPISENSFIGAAIGAAITGMRPVAEIMFVDFSGLAIDQIANQAAKLRYMFGGQANVPLVVRMPQGGGASKSTAAQHSQSLEVWYAHIPGLKVVLPSSPYDAKGLLKAAIRDDNPVIFLEHKCLYDVKGPVPEEDYVVPIGTGKVVRQGDDVTVVATGLMVHHALEAAERLAGEGIQLEVIDPRTISPLDKETLFYSVKKTGKVVLVQEACKSYGVAAEWAASIIESCFDYLDAPVVRVAGLDSPIPFADTLESQVWPNVEDIVAVVKRVMQ